MSEEIKKQETMDDFAQEIEASFSNFRDADMEIWDKLEQMKEDKEAFEVTIEGIVKGGAIAYVEGIRAFIPVSKLSLEYVKEPEEFLKKTLMVRVFEVDEAENRLVLSARELLKEQADAEKLAKTQQITVGSVLEAYRRKSSDLRRIYRPRRWHFRSGSHLTDQPETNQISKSSPLCWR